MKRTLIIVAAVLITAAIAVYGVIQWDQRRIFGNTGVQGLFNAMNKDFSDNKLTAELLGGRLTRYDRQGCALQIRIAVTSPDARKFVGHGFTMDLAAGRHEYRIDAEYRRDPGDSRRFQPAPGLYQVERITP